MAMWQLTLGLLSAANMQLSLCRLGSGTVPTVVWLLLKLWFESGLPSFLPSFLYGPVDKYIFYWLLSSCTHMFGFVSIILFHSASYEYVYMIYKCIMYMSIHECVCIYAGLDQLILKEASCHVQLRNTVTYNMTLGSCAKGSAWLKALHLFNEASVLKSWPGKLYKETVLSFFGIKPVHHTWHVDTNYFF